LISAADERRAFLGIGQRFEVVGLGLIDVSGFEIGQLLSFSDAATLAGIEPYNPSLVDRADDGSSIFRHENLSGRGDHSGNWGARNYFGLDRFIGGRLHRRG
jgi:hypothetical protein